MMLRALCIAGAVWLALGVRGGSCLGQQGGERSKGPSCAALELRLREVEQGSGSALERRAALLHLLDTVGEDPEDCVTRSAQSRLVDLEGQMVRLEVQAMTLAPDWLYQCAKIDDGQRCVGGTPYEDETPRNTNEEIRQGHAVALSGGTATIALAPGLACRVLTVWAGELQTLHPADRAPTILAHGATFPLARVRRMKAPVVVASIRCDDSLHFRKAAWLLLPERQGMR